MSSPILCRSMDDAQQALNRLADPSTREIVYDCETTGLDYRSCFIVGHVLTFGPAPSDTYYVPVRHHESHQGNVHPCRDRKGHPFEVELSRIMNGRRDLHSIGFNYMFDLMFLHEHGVGVVGTVEDAQVNAALLNEYARSYSLDSCCLAADAPSKKGEDLYKHLSAIFGGEPDRKQMQHFWKLSGDDAVGFDYAAGDGVATWALVAKQREMLAAQGLERIYHIERDVTRVLYRMKKRGVRIDLEKLAEVRTYAEGMVAEGLKVLPEGLNVRGPAQLKALFEERGYTDWPTTAPTARFSNGQPSFKEEWLKTNPVGQAVLNVRKWEHLLNSFIGPLETTHIRDGRIHPTYYQMANDDFGTCTGRLSCSGPNLQQVPKRNKAIAKIFRPIFVPDIGMEWWDADLSQCEPRLLAHYSGAKVLMDGYLAHPPVDAHQAVTDGVNAIGVPIDREDGKRVNQTLITGGGKAKIVAMLGARGEEIYEAYFNAMPEVRNFQKESNSRFKNRGYVVSLLGRRARLEARDKSYLAMNRLLQCGNADVVKYAMVRVDKHFEENGDVCGLLNNVHDALSMQAPPDRKEEVMEALRLFTDFGPGRHVPMRVPLQADYGVGPNWGVATFPSSKQVVG